MAVLGLKARKSGQSGMSLMGNMRNAPHEHNTSRPLLS